MGYAHYYYVRPEFDATAFSKVAEDFRRLVSPLSHLGVPLAGADGTGMPIITPTRMAFNGVKQCGHQKRGLYIAWPSETAGGVAQNSMLNTSERASSGRWFGGAILETRTCDGDCSHETFALEQRFQAGFERADGTTYAKEPAEDDDGRVNGRYFESCKTAYKPYDIAVTACLVIAKHHLRGAITIRSDGEQKDWNDAMNVCETFLGYGRDFALDD